MDPGSTDQREYGATGRQAALSSLWVIKGTEVSLGKEILQSGGASKPRGGREQGGASVIFFSHKLA